MTKTLVLWSQEALIDLETIYYFIAEKSPDAAQRMIESILSRVAQIEVFPESGSIQSARNSDRIYRYLIEANYKIIYSYRVEQQLAYIETVFDTRYNPEKLRL